MPRRGALPLRAALVLGLLAAASAQFDNSTFNAMVQGALQGLLQEDREPQAAPLLASAAAAAAASDSACRLLSPAPHPLPLSLQLPRSRSCCAA